MPKSEIRQWRVEFILTEDLPMPYEIAEAIIKHEVSNLSPKLRGTAYVVQIGNWKRRDGDRI